MSSLEADVVEVLTARKVPSLAIDVIERALPIIERVCARATGEFDPDGEGDDATLLGLTCARRSRNLIAGDVKAELEAVAVRWPRGALELDAGGCRLYVYAGQGDDAAPRLRGSTTKDDLLREFEQLTLLPAHDDEGCPPALLLAYRSSVRARGLVRAVVGVPDGADTWAWSVPIYAAASDDAMPVGPMPEAYDEAAVPAPVLWLREDNAEDRAEDER
jgi:hypothetical protein